MWLFVLKQFGISTIDASDLVHVIGLFAVCHIVKNFIAQNINAKVPLILGKYLFLPLQMFVRTGIN